MSFILLGILNSQAAGAPAGDSDYDLLETVDITTITANVTFSSLNSTYGSDYKHLQIRSLIRSTATGDGVGSLDLTFNNDTGANYAWHRLELAAIGEGITSSASTSRNAIDLSLTARDGSGTDDNFVAGVTDILDAFSTSKNTTVRSIKGGSIIGFDTTAGTIGMRSGLYNNTNAIDTIKLDPQGDFQPNCRISLYGIRG